MKFRITEIDFDFDDSFGDFPVKERQEIIDEVLSTTWDADDSEDLVEEITALQVGALILLITSTFFLKCISSKRLESRNLSELKAILNELPEHYLDQTATILLSDSDEYTKMRSIGWTGPACDVLGSDHMFSPLMLGMKISTCNILKILS